MEVVDLGDFELGHKSKHATQLAQHILGRVYKLKEIKLL